MRSCHPSCRPRAGRRAVAAAPLCRQWRRSRGARCARPRPGFAAPNRSFAPAGAVAGARPSRSRHSKSWRRQRAGRPRRRWADRQRRCRSHRTGWRTGPSPPPPVAAAAGLLVQRGRLHGRRRRRGAIAPWGGGRRAGAALLGAAPLSAPRRYVFAGLAQAGLLIGGGALAQTVGTVAFAEAALEPKRAGEIGDRLRRLLLLAIGDAALQSSAGNA